MDQSAEVGTGSGVAVSAAAVAQAEALAALVREATLDLPFGTEPATFTVLLERLAPDEKAGS